MSMSKYADPCLSSCGSMSMALQIHIYNSADPQHCGSMSIVLQNHVFDSAVPHPMDTRIFTFIALRLHIHSLLDLSKTYASMSITLQSQVCNSLYEQEKALHQRVLPTTKKSL